MDFEQVIPYLSFLTTWMDKERFPTHETSETKVREDLQQLHNETQQYINTQLIPALVSILDQTASKEALNDLVAGQVPVDSVKAEHLAPEVREQLNAAAVETAVAQRMAERYTKTETLSDAAKTAFGLPDSATPASVFDLLGRYAQHCWLKEKPPVLVPKEAPEAVRLDLSHRPESDRYASGAVFGRGTSIAVDANGRIYITDQRDSASSYDLDAGTFAGEYITGKPSNITGGLPEGHVYHVDGVGLHKRSYFGSSKYYYETYVNAYLVTVQPQADGTPEFVFSDNRNAYPDCGEQDGFQYTYLGAPLAKTTSGLRWKLGSYTGTGVFGEAQPNALEFDFVPQLVLFVTDATHEVHAYLSGYAPDSMFVRDGCKLTWHAASADKQLNAANVVYGYIAFG